MKALVLEKYGTPDVLELRELPEPTPKEDEVVVEVQYASVNSWDWDWLTGSPRAYRLLHGLFRPRLNVLGADVSGVVARVGSGVTRFRVGDEVVGDLSAGSWGCFAELVAAPEASLVPKPQGVTFEDAAALPQAACMAYQAFQSGGGLRPGQRVLVNGAGGGVGTFAIQLARHFGASVAAIDVGSKLDLLRSLGAERVVDFEREDFTQSAERYDFVLDVTAHRPATDFAKVLLPGGRYVMLGGTVRRLLALLLTGWWLGRRHGVRFSILPAQPNYELPVLLELVTSGAVKPVIDSVVPLSKAEQAFWKIGRGKSRGKLLIAPERA